MAYPFFLLNLIIWCVTVSSQVKILIYGTTILQKLEMAVSFEIVSALEWLIDCFRSLATAATYSMLSA